MGSTNRLHGLGTDAIRLLRPIWPIVLASTGIGAASGLATAGVLAKINEAFHGDGGLADGFLMAFAGLALLSVAGHVASGLGGAFASGRIVAALNMDLVDQILSTPIERMERIGKHKLLASLQRDIDTIGQAIGFLSQVVIALGTVIGCCAYMIYLSPTLFAITAIGLALGILVENWIRRGMMKEFEASRTLREVAQKHYLSITEGAKELRVGRARRMRLRDISLRECIEAQRRITTRLSMTIQNAWAASTGILYLLFAVLIAYKLLVGVSNADLSGFVIVLLYVNGPIMQLVHYVPHFGAAQVAYRRIAEFSAGADESEPNLLGRKPAPPSLSIREIALSGVSHTFPAEGDKVPFTLGPIDLRIKAGEILFIVGENGSGKTTLIKLLLGLYAPQTGTLFLDGEPVTAETRDDYRQHLSAIFFDYHLFEDVIVPDGTDIDAAASHLERLDLARKVTIAEGRFTTTDLSTGQRKRLALVQAYLEGRPVLVLDEWAAEQDPTFRRLFYTELLPDLKRRGRTLVVISHDDRYFGAADRVIHLKNGAIVEATWTEPAVPRSAYFGSA